MVFLSANNKDIVILKNKILFIFYILTLNDLSSSVLEYMYIIQMWIL